jgi:AbrB family looped-hinge helix DNA binding protein
MSEHHTVVTRKGQITLPAEVRRALGLRKGDKVAVELIGAQAIIKPAESVVARTAGAVQAEAVPLSAGELRILVEEAWAEDAVQRGL